MKTIYLQEAQEFIDFRKTLKDHTGQLVHPRAHLWDVEKIRRYLQRESEACGWTAFALDLRALADCEGPL